MVLVSECQWIDFLLYFWTPLKFSWLCAYLRKGTQSKISKNKQENKLAGQWNSYASSRKDEGKEIPQIEDITEKSLGVGKVPDERKGRTIRRNGKRLEAWSQHTVHCPINYNSKSQKGYTQLCHIYSFYEIFSLLKKYLLSRENGSN